MLDKATRESIDAIISLAEDAYQTTNGNPHELLDVGRIFSAAGVILMQAADLGLSKDEVVEQMLQIRMRVGMTGPRSPAGNRIVVPGHGNSSKGEKAEKLVRSTARKRRRGRG